ncbi:MAG: hypothetical protein ACRDRR_18300 [Pseudonocardiaceae bacterium]
MTPAAGRLVPDGDPFLFDLLLAVMDSDSDRAGQLLYARTGRDIRKMSVVCGMLADFTLSIGEMALGSRDDLRRALQHAATLHQLDALSDAGVEQGGPMT